MLPIFKQKPLPEKLEQEAVAAAVAAEEKTASKEDKQAVPAEA